METVKKCLDCGCVIATIDGSDWYRMMSVKRCDRCAKIAKRRQTAESKRRARKQEQDTVENTLLRVENAQLRNERDYWKQLYEEVYEQLIIEKRKQG